MREWLMCTRCRRMWESYLPGFDDRCFRCDRLPPPPPGRYCLDCGRGKGGAVCDCGSERERVYE